MITVYGGPNCPACDVLKECLDARGVDYEEYSIEYPEIARYLNFEKNVTSIPLVEWPDGTETIGFHRDVVESKIRETLGGGVSHVTLWDRFFDAGGRAEKTSSMTEEDCTQCGRVIPAGEPHVYGQHWFEGVVYTFWICEDCDFREYHEVPDDQMGLFAREG